MVSVKQLLALSVLSLTVSAVPALHLEKRQDANQRQCSAESTWYMEHCDGKNLRSYGCT